MSILRSMASPGFVGFLHRNCERFLYPYVYIRTSWSHFHFLPFRLNVYSKRGEESLTIEFGHYSFLWFGLVSVRSQFPVYWQKEASEKATRFIPLSFSFSKSGFLNRNALKLNALTLFRLFAVRVKEIYDALTDGWKYLRLFASSRWNDKSCILIFHVFIH